MMETPGKVASTEVHWLGLHAFKTMLARKPALWRPM
jgi:hypothetical protein